MARLKLTETNLKTLVPLSGEIQTYYWDTGTANFGVLVGTKTRTFFVRAYLPTGKRKRIALGHSPDLSLKDARVLAVNAGAQTRKGTDLNLLKKKAGGPTVREALDAHLLKMSRGENRQGKVCSARSIETMRSFVLLHLRSYLNGPLVALTREVITALRDQLEDGKVQRADANKINPGGRANSNRLVQMVRTIWRSWDDLLSVPDPTAKMVLRALAARETRVDDSDLPTWYTKVQTINPIRRDLQLVSLFTGIRADGVRNLRFEDVDFVKGTIQIQKAKGGKIYTVPMVRTVREILETRQRDNGPDGGFCFPSVSRDGERIIPIAEPKERKIVRGKDGKAKRKNGKVIRESFLPGMHANRRTFNSVAIEIGIPPEPREALMNHSGKGVNVKHYGAPQKWDYLQECADRIESALWFRIKAVPTVPPKPTFYQKIAVASSKVPIPTKTKTDPTNCKHLLAKPGTVCKRCGQVK